MTKDEALKLALEALGQLQGGCTDSDDGTVEAITVWCPEVIAAIKEALEEPQTTHSEGCYKWHHQCAIAEIERVKLREKNT